jgi:transcriptional regulator
MHIPSKYIVKDTKLIQHYITENPFGTLVSQNQKECIATHTIFRLHEDKLWGHISVVNEQKEAIKNGQELLAIFMQNHSYISSSWYDHINVPTWNYIAVHIYGKARVLDDNQTLNLLNDLTDHYEKGRENAFSIDKMSDKSLKSHLKGLIAFEMSMDRIEASWKLSQNRDEKNYKEIIKKLKTEKDPLAHAIAEEMEKLIPKLY